MSLVLRDSDHAHHVVSRLRWHGTALGLRLAIWIILPIAGALWLYGAAVSGPWIADDKIIVRDNPMLRDPSWQNAAAVWTLDYWSQRQPDGSILQRGPDHNLYRPFTMFTFVVSAATQKPMIAFVGQVNHLLGAGNLPLLLEPTGPIWFRLLNVLLHAAAAAMIGLWCARWVGTPGGIAAMIVVLVHPAGTDVIGRVVGRSDILVLLGVASFLFVQRGAQLHGWTWRRALLAGVWALLAMSAKELGIIVIPLAITQTLLHRAEIRSAALEDPHHTIVGRFWAWREVFAVTGALAIYLAARLPLVGWPAYQQDPAFDLLENPMLRAGLMSRITGCLDIAWYYTHMLIAPTSLVAFDTPRAIPGWSATTVWLGLAALIAVCVLTFTLLRRGNIGAMAGVWWLSGLAVLGQFIMPMGVYREVRLIYPLTGALALVVAWAVSRAHELRWSRHPALATGLITALMLHVIVASMAVTARMADYRSELALLGADANTEPANAGIQLRMGTALIEENRFADAQRAKLRAVELAPDSSQTWYELGNLAAHRGDYSAAWGYSQHALRVRKDNYQAMANSAVILIRMGNLKSARELLLRAEQIRPDCNLVQFNLAWLDAHDRQWDRATRRLRDVLRRDPDDQRSRNLLRETIMGEKTATIASPASDR